MFRSIIGDVGHFLVLTAFLSAVIATIAFFRSTVLEKSASLDNEDKLKSWRSFARVFFYIHAVAVMGVVTSLYVIISNHYYEYHYAWSHSSQTLPFYYMISAFWEGQEGSFLLWMFWHVLLGVVLIKVNKTWETPVMTIFCAVQAFLASMVIGAVIPLIDLKIGSSPFVLLREQMADLPVFVSNPDFIPEDGSGLNPLLQNIWMVIHPPVLFLGFAATLVPFAYCMAGLWQKRYKEWIRPALPWALFAAITLGAGILMGGYWAYETLNFGGYWNWDPVENAVYVPWLILIGSIHGMISFKNSGSALKLSVILVCTTFILILYSTFLTRSGILGDASVHSFTDLGLSGQLLIYLLFFVFISIFMIAWRWKALPVTEKETTVYSREFWVFAGISVLCLAAFQVIYTTSIPVFNAIIKAFGGESNIAPPADQEIYYSNWQIWFAIGIAILSGIGQFFWWKKMNPAKLWDAIAIPLILTLVVSSAIIFFAELSQLSYILLTTAAVFSVLCNGSILYNVFRNNYKLAGGAFAHIGVGLMLIGILFSSGYSKVISLNNSGMLYSKEFSDQMNQENVLLWRNEAMRMDDYELIYKGPRLEVRGMSGFFPKNAFVETMDADIVLAKKDIYNKDKKLFSKGDTVNIYGENIYFEVEYRKDNGQVFTLFPRAQINPQMGLLASPDIKRYFGKDLYTHVSSIPVADDDKKWSEDQDYHLQVGDTVVWNDYITVFKGVDLEKDLPGLTFNEKEFAVKSKLAILKTDEDIVAEPMFVVKDEMIGQIPEVFEDLGLKITLVNVNTETGEFHFKVNTTQKDYIILKAIEKPLINVLWIGTLVLMLGIGMAVYRRYTEFAKMRDKGLE
ncbi:cytochrome c biogenesis protein CcsA [Cytophagaceae bacterium ABcell3]|nr:cytochrome c biogenesis protein CcsA [Cytophagaceae bacterium ABcell3]